MGHRDYKKKYPSVTTILGILRKIGLEIWFKCNTAEFCDEKSRRGREIGKQIHEAIQSHIEEGKVKIETQYADEVKTALESFVKFKKEHPEIKLKKAEMQVTSEKHKYNGTLDCLGNDGIPVVVDWKTGECKGATEPKIYEEHIYQTAAYVSAYNEQEKKHIKKAYVVAFGKDAVGYNLRVVEETELGEAFNEVFLPALSIYNYQRGK